MVPPKMFSQKCEKQEAFAVVSVFSIFTPGFRTDFHVILQKTYSSTQIKVPGKIYWLQNLGRIWEESGRNVFEAVCFSKVASLHRTDSSFSHDRQILTRDAFGIYSCQFIKNGIHDRSFPVLFQQDRSFLKF